MNEYEIVFSMIRISNPRRHYSNCTATIKGDTYEEALKDYKEEKRKEDWFIMTMQEILDYE